MAKKDFGRRLMPEYLLKYSEELQKNHPDPSASWGGGGGGGDYTAGEGIDITGDVISIDEEVVAKKTDIPDVSDFVTDTDLNTALADYELKSEAFSGSYDDLTDKPTLATVATTGDYDDLLNKPTIPTVPSVLSAFTNDVGYITGITSADVVTALGYTPGTSNFSGDYDDLSDKPTIPDSTSDLVNDSGFITGITSTMIANALGYTPGTSNFSGSYNDLTDKPTIPTVNNPTITFTQGGTTKGTITLNQSTNQTIALDAGGTSSAANVTKALLHISENSGSWNIVLDSSVDMDSILQMLTFVEVEETTYNPTTTTVHELTNISLEELSTNVVKFKFIEDMPLANYIESRTVYLTVDWTATPTTYTWSDYSVVQVNYPTVTSLPWSSITGKPTFATVATSGSYNDLSDKPTIPDTSNFVTTNTTQTITGYKTFTDKIKLTDIFNGLDLEIKNSASLIGFSYNSRDFELPVTKPGNPGSPYILATTDDIPTVNDATITFTQGGVSKGSITLNQAGNQTIALDAGGGTVAWDDITNKPTFATVATSGSYADLSNKPSIPSTASSTSTSTVTPTTQTLIFTLDDDSTVTVNVMTGATVATTTTTTLS